MNTNGKESTQAVEKGAIEQRLAELTAERDRFLAQANQQAAAYAGAIGELRKLLNLSPEGMPMEEVNAKPGACAS